VTAPNVQIVRLHPDRDADLPFPAYQTAGAAGADLCAAINEPWTLQPLQRVLVPTGLSLAIPVGFEGQVRPRSGIAVKRGLTVPNAPGTIDSDYRGELFVALVNLDPQPQTIVRGERVAQLVIAPCVQATFVAVSTLDATARGDGGFGSTGRHA
jgi:dUTP pyrophosphatase